MALGRLHPSDEYDIRIAVEEGEGGSLDGKWIAMLVDEIEHYSGENTRLTALLAERDAEIVRHAALLVEMRQTWAKLDDIDVFIDPERAGEWHAARNRMDYLVSDHCAALAARGGAWQHV